MPDEKISQMTDGTPLVSGDVIPGVRSGANIKLTITEQALFGTQGANIASATTTNLDAATGFVVDVTGTTTITGITLSQGHTRIVRFTGALILTNGSNLVLPGGANITTVAGDYALFVGYASSVVRCVYYTAASNLEAFLNAAQTYTKAQRGAFSPLTDASTIALDFSLANYFRVVLGGNRTLGVPSNLSQGQSGVINVRQDITGNRTLAYSWVWENPGTTVPVLSTGKLAFDSLGYLVNHYATSTVTMTIAAPGVITWTSHGMASGYKLQLTTTGALPTGLSANTTYWVTVIDANTFNLSTSLANAQAATFITTSGSQSGVHTATTASITLAANLSIG